jgi:16S rRNA U516 pseudouridylate synthase RsuA-like enzyme
MDVTFPVRINKYLAVKRGITRREADTLVTQRRVYVNGRLAILGDKVDEHDHVDVRFRT